MKEMKDLASLIVYCYVFMISVNENNFILLILVVVLGFILFDSKLKIRNFAKVQKEQLKKQREFFINSLRHDLRIPVIAQIRILELINKESFGKLSSEQKEIFSQFEDSTKSLLNLISLMINTYNIENQNYKLICRKFNLSEVIISSFSDLQEQAKEKNITFEYKNMNTNLNITADKDEIKKVLINILSSAISNSSYGENISVTAGLDNGKIKLSVTGENEKNIYSNPYFNTLYTSIGQNIRMCFCKKIVETHKGRFLNLGMKNSFSLELPVICV